MPCHRIMLCTQDRATVIASVPGMMNQRAGSLKLPRKVPRPAQGLSAGHAKSTQKSEPLLNTGSQTSGVGSMQGTKHLLLKLLQACIMSQQHLGPPAASMMLPRDARS